MREIAARIGEVKELEEAWVDELLLTFPSMTGCSYMMR
jgi:hypothetical protein